MSFIHQIATSTVNGYLDPIIIPDTIKDFNQTYCFNNFNTNSYVRLLSIFIDILKTKNPAYSREFFIYPLTNFTWEEYNGIKIKGLTQDKFNELHELLPDVKSGNRGRKLIYDGLE